MKTAKSQTLALARKVYGKQAEVEYSPWALDAAEKAALSAERKLWLAQRATLKEKAQGLAKSRQGLLAAARFVVDVGGDDPSIPQLRQAVEAVERLILIEERLLDLSDMLRKSEGKVLSRRCSVKLNKGWCYEVVESGDSWEEVAGKLQAKLPATCKGRTP